MKALCDIISGILAVVIFTTTLCAQTCVDPNPVSSCPAHQTKDCCKHEDGSAEQARAGSPVVAPQQFMVHLPVQIDHSFVTELQTPITAFDRFHSPPGYAPPISPTDNPLALRI